MTMRAFVVPKPQTLQQFTKAADGSEVLVDRDYTFENFLTELVWPNHAWRNNAESVEAWYTSQDLLAGALPGKQIVFDDATWQIFKPIATLQGRDLPGAVPLQLSRLMRPILQARQITKEDLAEPSVS